MSLLQDLGYYGPGNWSIGNFKLPEFGITEKFGGGDPTSLSDATRTRTLGEGVSGPVIPSTQDFGVTEGFDRVLGTDVSGGGAVGTDNVPNLPSSGGGGGGGGGGGYDSGAMLEGAGIERSEKSGLFKQYGVDNTPDLLQAMRSAQAQAQQAAQAEQERIEKEISSIYDPTMKYLGKAEKSVRGSYGDVRGEIGSMIGEQKNVAGQLRGEGASQIGLQEQQGGQRREDALADATRIYNEMTRGGQQRYGGASSAGEAYQAVSGQELQRNRASITSQYNQFMQQAGVAKQNLQSQYSTAIQNLESQKNRQLSEARRNFDSSLLEINRLRAGMESEKANRKLQALQELRNQAYQINLSVMQNQQALQQQANAVNTALDQRIQEAGTKVSQSLSGVQSEVPRGAYTPPQQARGPQMVGSINRFDDELYTGVVNPVRRQEDELQTPQ